MKKLPRLYHVILLLLSFPACRSLPIDGGQTYQETRRSEDYIPAAGHYDRINSRGLRANNSYETYRECMEAAGESVLYFRCVWIND